MKKFLVLFLTLLSLVSFGQGWQKVKRTKANGSIERGWVRRNLSVYPTTQVGEANFYRDVNNGTLAITTVDPFSSPSLPVSVTGAVGPGWGSSRYSLSSGQLFTVEAAGDIASLKVERNDGTVLSGTSPDIGAASTNTFYNFVSQSVTSWPKTLRVVWSPTVANQSLKLTYKRTNGDTYSQNVTPAPLATNVPLFTAPGSTTTTQPTTTTALTFQIVAYNCQTGVLNYRFVSSNSASIAVSIPGVTNSVMSPGVVTSYTFPSDQRNGTTVNVNASQGGQVISTNFITSCTLGPTTTDPPTSTTQVAPSGGYARVLVVGNSITNNGGHIGLAASSQSKDYFHILKGYFQTLNPNVDMRDLSDGMGMVEWQGPVWEGTYWNPDPDLYARFDNAAAFKPEIMLVSLGENVKDESHDFKTAYKALIDKLRAQNPGMVVVLRTSTWNQNTVDGWIRQVGAERGYPVAEMEDIPGGRLGTAGHPNDGAMQIIADRFWAVIPKTSTPTNPTGPVYTPDDFSYTPLSSYVAPGDSMVTIETPYLRSVISLYGKMSQTVFGPRLGGNIYKLYSKVYDPNFTLHHYAHISIDRPGGNPPNASEFAAGRYTLGTGYGVGNCIYMNPNPNKVNSQIGMGMAEAKLYKLGRNPNPGDEFSNTALVLRYGLSSDGKTYYTMTQPPLYNANGAYAYGTIYEDWTTFSDHIVERHSKITTNYTKPIDSADGYGMADYLRSDPQEMPCLYANGSRDDTGHNKDQVSMYMGSAPCTGGGLTTVTVTGKKLDDGTPVYTSIRGNSHNVTEPWILIHSGAPAGQPIEKARGIGLITTVSSVRIGNFGSGDSNQDLLSPNTNTTYVAENPRIIFDNQGVVYYRYREFVGTIEEIRAEACKNANQFPTGPNYRFNKADRLKWSYDTFGDAPIQGQAPEKRTFDDGANSIGTAGYWALHFSRSPYSNLRSPGVAWPASVTKKIYIRMSYTGQNSSWGFSWVQNGQLPNRAPQDAEERTLFPKGQVPSEQNVNFSVIGDGQVRTYVVDLTSNPRWADIITEINFQPHASGMTAGTEHANVYWISTSPDGPTN